MSSAEFDLAGDVEQAWTRFRGRLADRIAGIEDDDSLYIELEVGADDSDLAGAAPYLQYLGWGGDLVRAEVVSNNFLDERWRLTDDDEELLVDIGWLAPTYDADGEPDSGSANFHVDLGLREADLLAVMSVRALREAFGCAHPAFLSADGLEDDPMAAPVAAIDPALPDEALATFPESEEHLRELVDRALVVMFVEPLRHDEDGDVPVVAGKSVVFVQVATDRPAVDLFAELVVKVRDRERAQTEVSILNYNHPGAKFYLVDDRVVVTHRIYAWPFAPDQLRVALAQLCEEIDDIARDLVLRVGGIRFTESEPAEPSRPASDVPLSDAVADPDDAHPAMVGLLELLLDGPVAPGVVATMFSGDAELITSQIARVRSGAQSCGEHDPEAVAALLRQALRLVVEAQAERESFGRSRSSTRARSRQLALLPEPEGSPEAGLWSHDLGETP